MPLTADAAAVQVQVSSRPSGIIRILTLFFQERLKALQLLIHEIQHERLRNEPTVGLIKVERLGDDHKPIVSQVRKSRSVVRKA